MSFFSFVKYTKSKCSPNVGIQLFTKSFCTSGKEIPVKEFKIPVPWGHISGKEWGSSSNGIPTLAVHGWLDNASTFDALIPHLKSNLHIFAMDLPGHGRSSHYGAGATYGYNEALVAITYCLDYFHLKKFAFLGHSLGGELGFLISSLYPESVLKFIAIDLMKPVAHLPEFMLSKSRKYLDNFKNMSDKSYGNPPSYTEDEAVDRLVKGYNGSIGKDSAKILLRRHLVPSPSGKGFTFGFDRRLKLDYLYMPVSNDLLMSFAKNISCDFLFIKAIPGEYYESKEEYKRVHEYLKKEMSNYHYTELEGSHHIHLESPKLVASTIDKFLLNTN